MKRIFIFLLSCMVSWSGASVIFASSPGNPLGMVGAGRLAISAEWDQDNRDLELDADSEVTSNRYWLKGTYGLTDWLDVSGAAGFVDFDVSSLGTRSSSYESDHMTFCFQGGFKLRPFCHEEKKLSAFLTAHGSHLQAKEFVGSVRPEKLSWNEFQMAVSVAKKYGFAFPYVGVLYSLVDGELMLAGGDGPDFQDPGALAFAGIDFSLPSRYALTFEVRGRLGGDTDEISFSIGLSQRTE